MGSFPHDALPAPSATAVRGMDTRLTLSDGIFSYVLNSRNNILHTVVMQHFYPESLNSRLESFPWIVDDSEQIMVNH